MPVTAEQRQKVEQWLDNLGEPILVVRVGGGITNGERYVMIPIEFRMDLLESHGPDYGMHFRALWITESRYNRGSDGWQEAGHLNIERYDILGPAAPPVLMREEPVYENTSNTTDPIQYRFSLGRPLLTDDWGLDMTTTARVAIADEVDFGLRAQAQRTLFGIREWRNSNES